jgi:hypothetical protein
MSWIKKSSYACFTLVAGLASVIYSAGAVLPDEPGKAAPTVARPSAAEARERARLLHGFLHDTLQFVHSRYFREDEGLPIPAAGLKSVFEQMEERNDVQLRWLAVDTPAMNVDHKARTAFEKEAVKALKSGKEDFEGVEDDVYRYVGFITLGSDCLKCHLPGRTSNKSRLAGLVVTLPIETK